MAGHSKWANIRHRKDRQDQKKGKMWSKCSKAIMAAARAGGGDPETNLSLRYAIDEAKYENMPKDTIQRAVDKGAGAGAGEDWSEVTYEGYGPKGIAIIVDALTDNKTRTFNDIRMIFNKHGGNLGSPGCVAFMFQTKGQMFVDASKVDEDTIMTAAIDAGAEDVQAPDDDDGAWTVLTDPIEFIHVKEAMIASGIEIEASAIAKLADNTIEICGESAKKLLNLIDLIEDNDDVQKVYTNAEIPDEDLE